MSLPSHPSALTPDGAPAKPLTIPQHKDKLRGRCALALDWNAKITLALANTIRCSPMRGTPAASLSAIEACREYMAKMAEWLDQAEQSAIAIRELEAEEGGRV